jgi:ankyrin repeat protein
MDLYEGLSFTSNSWREAFQAYVQSGGDLNVQGDGGWTFLHSAVELQNIEAVKWLVDNGANINLPNVYGWTPLHWAVGTDIDLAIQSGEELTMETTRTLIELGADQSFRNDRGKTPRDIAAGHGKNTLALYDSIVKHSREQDDKPKG